MNKPLIVVKISQDRIIIIIIMGITAGSREIPGRKGL
jgi:hypothetical protein